MSNLIGKQVSFNYFEDYLSQWPYMAKSQLENNPEITSIDPYDYYRNSVGREDTTIGLSYDWHYIMGKSFESDHEMAAVYIEFKNASIQLVCDAEDPEFLKNIIG